MKKFLTILAVLVGVSSGVHAVDINITEFYERHTVDNVSETKNPVPSLCDLCSRVIVRELPNLSECNESFPEGLAVDAFPSLERAYSATYIPEIYEHISNGFRLGLPHNMLPWRYGGSIRQAAISTDGTHVAYVHDGYVHVYNRQEFSYYRLSLPAGFNANDVTMLSFSFDNGVLLFMVQNSSVKQRTIFVWHFYEKTCRTLDVSEDDKCPFHYIDKIAFVDDTIVYSDSEPLQSLNCIDIKTGKHTYYPLGFVHGNSALALSLDQQSVAFNSGPEIVLLNLVSGIASEFKAEADVCSLQFSADQQSLIACDLLGNISKFDVGITQSGQWPIKSTIFDETCSNVDSWLVFQRSSVAMNQNSLCFLGTKVDGERVFRAYTLDRKTGLAVDAAEFISVKLLNSLSCEKLLMLRKQLSTTDACQFQRQEVMPCTMVDLPWTSKMLEAKKEYIHRNSCTVS